MGLGAVTSPVDTKDMVHSKRHTHCAESSHGGSTMGGILWCKGVNRGRPFPVQTIKKISQRKLSLKSELEVEAVNEAGKRARAKVPRGTHLALSACKEGSREPRLSVLCGLHSYRDTG